MCFAVWKKNFWYLLKMQFFEESAKNNTFANR